MLTATQYKLNRTKTFNLLNDLELSAEAITTLYLPAGASETETNHYLEQLKSLELMRAEIGKAIVVSQTGIALFWGKSRKLLISPPFPIKDKFWTNGCDTTPLKSLVARDYTIGIILVRLGSYAIGVCKGEQLIEHKTGTGQVHGRQRQGGSSSNRYRRRREVQTHHFLERVADHAEEKLAPYERTLDYLVYGGARTTIHEFSKHSRFLRQFDERLLPPLLNITEPRYEVLVSAVNSIWVSRITEWHEDKATA
jgi:peptide subunit release factor 1 (eRF1)